jgi:hypothetical protein
MENIERKVIENKNEKNVHKSLCTECPAYNECMGIWLDYFAGNGYRG